MAAANRRWFREMLPYFCFTLPGACFPIPCVYLAHLYQGRLFWVADMARVEDRVSGVRPCRDVLWILLLRTPVRTRDD